MTRRLVAFDYDDTLVDTRGAKYEAIKTLCEREYGFRVESELLNEHWGGPYRNFFESVFSNSGVDVDVDEAISIYEGMETEFPITAFPDMIESVMRISAKYDVCIVSSCGRRQLLSQLNNVFPGHPFRTIFAAEDTPYHKPDPRVFDGLIEHLRNVDVGISKVVYVGDSPKDMCAANGAGFRFIGLARTVQDRIEMLMAGATVVKSLSQISLLLEGAGFDR